MKLIVVQAADAEKRYECIARSVQSSTRFARTPEGHFFAPVIERRLISLEGYIGRVTPE